MKNVRKLLFVGLLLSMMVAHSVSYAQHANRSFLGDLNVNPTYSRVVPSAIAK